MQNRIIFHEKSEFTVDMIIRIKTDPLSGLLSYPDIEFTNDTNSDSPSDLMSDPEKLVKKYYPEHRRLSGKEKPKTAGYRFFADYSS